ncbi:hypothetical protein [Salipaludibacillus keqinensis]|nr:hypothetical protein [Salipaludibacillus keqinensis]
MNDKLDALNEQKSGLSEPMKFVALFLGFVILGPLIALIMGSIF